MILTESSAAAPAPRRRGRATSAAPGGIEALNTTMTILLVAGTRPNFMKIAPIQRALARARPPGRGSSTPGSTSTPSMSDVFFRDLGLPAPDVTLKAGGGSHAEQTAAVLVGVEAELVDAPARASSSSSATSPARSPRRSPRRSSASPSCTSRRASARATGRCPRRSTASSPISSRICSSRLRTTPQPNLRAEGHRPTSASSSSAT